MKKLAVLTVGIALLALMLSPLAQYQADAFKEGKMMKAKMMKDKMMKAAFYTKGDLTAPAEDKPFGGDNIGNYKIRMKPNNKVTVIAKVSKDMMMSDKVLEGWLVDVDSGYKLSTGQLNERNMLVFGQRMVNPMIYDLIVVTSEPMNDTDPTPDTPIGGAQLHAGTLMNEEDKTMNEEMPEVMKEEGPTKSLSGNFVGADFIHNVEGMATVYLVDDGQRTLRLENFKSTPGPDVFVYLSKDARSIGDGFIDLGKLKGNMGNQNYQIPDDVNLDEYNNVLIWCRLFSVLFGNAELTPA